VNSRNGYRREWDTRAGTIELAIPKLRQGSYFRGFLEHRRRAERALASVVATSYLLGFRPGGWRMIVTAGKHRLGTTPAWWLTSLPARRVWQSRLIPGCTAGRTPSSG